MGRGDKGTRGSIRRRWSWWTLIAVAFNWSLGPSTACSCRRLLADDIVRVTISFVRVCIGTFSLPLLFPSLYLLLTPFLRPGASLNPPSVLFIIIVLSGTFVCLWFMTELLLTPWVLMLMVASRGEVERWRGRRRRVRPQVNCRGRTLRHPLRSRDCRHSWGTPQQRPHSVTADWPNWLASPSWHPSGLNGDDTGSRRPRPAALSADAAREQIGVPALRPRAPKAVPAVALRGRVESRQVCDHRLAGRGAEALLRLLEAKSAINGQAVVIANATPARHAVQY